MKILHHGDVLVFRCKKCGCVFAEAVSRTDLEHAGVYDPDHDGLGARAECPDCGSDVLGFREKLKPEVVLDDGR